MNSVFFFHPRFWQHLKRLAKADTMMDSSVADKILEFKPLHKVTDPLYWITRLLSGLCSIDRTGKLNNFKTQYEPIPDVTGFNKSFGQICLETAERYWQEHDYLQVLWSGGIDSTSTALALLETKPKDKTLVIVGTQSSIDEYPGFYDRYKEFCRVLTFEQFFSLANLNSGAVVITGDVGDQIFGANLAVSHPDEADLYKKDRPWHELFDWDDVFKQSTIARPPNSRDRAPWTRFEKNNLIAVLEDHALACPFPIRTCFDMSWWLNFSMKTNYVTVRIPLLIIENCGQQVERMDLTKRKAFYLNADFQLWSMTNHDIKIAAESRSYKQPSKDFIFSISGDADYARNKQKEPSTPKLLEENWFGNWRRNDAANYLMLSDGSMFNNTRDIPTKIVEEIFDL
jgi:hypothetical protein